MHVSDVASSSLPSVGGRQYSNKQVYNLVHKSLHMVQRIEPAGVRILKVTEKND